MSNKVWGGLGALVIATVASVFALEGGYVNDPNDAGGETNHGITEQVARNYGYLGSMRDLPKGIAQDIYIRNYIEQPKFDRVLALSPAVGTKLVDAGVNAGPGRASIWFQQSLNDLSRGGRDYPIIGVDGAIGSQTLNAYKALEKHGGRTKACELTLKALDSYQSQHYLRLAQGKANSSFIVGWLDNRINNVEPSRCTEEIAP